MWLESKVRFERVRYKDIGAEYGQVITDECHHVSAFSFERVLRKVKVKYVMGLTATPIRKDGTQSSSCNAVLFAST